MFPCLLLSLLLHFSLLVQEAPVSQFSIYWPLCYLACRISGGWECVQLILAFLGPCEVSGIQQMLHKGAHSKTLAQHWKDGDKATNLGLREAHREKSLQIHTRIKQALTPSFKFSLRWEHSHFLGLFNTRGNRSNSDLGWLDYSQVHQFHFTFAHGFK